MFVNSKGVININLINYTNNSTPKNYKSNSLLCVLICTFPNLELPIHLLTVVANFLFWAKKSQQIFLFLKFSFPLATKVHLGLVSCLHCHTHFST